MTELERIQKKIDKCNHYNGCRNKCTPEQQKNCWLLQQHEARIEFCKKNNMDIRFW